MARLGIFTGSSPNDGTGDSLAAGAVKVNANFSEIYSTFGDGNNLISYVTTAGVSTLAGNLTGNPSVSVTKIVSSATSSVVPFLWNSYGEFPLYPSVQGAVAFANDTKKLYYAQDYWAQLVNVSADGRVGTGTEGYNVGLVEAVNFSGDGSLISGIKLPFRNQGFAVGLAGTVNFVGAGVTVENNGGIATVTISPTGGGITTETDPIFTASVAFGIGAGDTSNWTTAYSWGNHAVVGYATQGYVDAAVSGVSTFSGDYNDLTNKPTIPVNINDLSDVNAGAPSTGQVLKWSGSEWQASSDLTAAGAGIGLSDLSVTIASPGISSLTYNNTTGVFEFTPININSYLTNVNVSGALTASGKITAQYYDLTGIGQVGYGGSNLSMFANYNFEIQTGISEQGEAGPYWSFGTDGSITFPDSTVQTTAYTGAAVGSAGTWAVNAAGIHTSKNVGIGTELSSSALWVEGDGRFSGVVTATRFESTSAGTPTIDSPNNLNINAVTVAISTDLTVGGDAYVGVDTSSGLILTSPNGTQYRLVVDNSGNLSTVLVP